MIRGGERESIFPSLKSLRTLVCDCPGQKVCVCVCVCDSDTLYMKFGERASICSGASQAVLPFGVKLLERPPAINDILLGREVLQ